MRKTSITRYSDEASFLRVPLSSFVTLSLVLGQISWLIEFTLKRKFKKARSQAHRSTVESRAKAPDFWIPYQEEWENPPIQKAQQRLAKKRWYRTISGPIIRILLTKGDCH